MGTLLDLVASIVASHASKTAMTTEQLVQELQTVHTALRNLEGIQSGDPSSDQATEESKTVTMSIKQAFRKDEVICMVCGKGGFKTLKKHLATAHQFTPGQYRKQFGIKSTQKLAARSFSEARRKSAEERGMSAVLAKARETRMANLTARKAAENSTSKPAKASKNTKTAAESRGKNSKPAK